MYKNQMTDLEAEEKRVNEIKRQFQVVVDNFVFIKLSIRKH